MQPPIEASASNFIVMQKLNKLKFYLGIKQNGLNFATKFYKTGKFKIDITKHKSMQEQ